MRRQLSAVAARAIAGAGTSSCVVSLARHSKNCGAVSAGVGYAGFRRKELETYKGIHGYDDEWGGGWVRRRCDGGVTFGAQQRRVTGDVAEASGVAELGFDRARGVWRVIAAQSTEECGVSDAMLPHVS